MGTVFGVVAAVTEAGPRIRRVVFTVPDLAELPLPDAGDDALGIYFPAAGQSRPPAMECRDGFWAYFDDAPQGRNFTVRRRGPGPDQITCDFVLHQRGVASDWVRRVRPGDQVVLAHARSWYRPEPMTRWRLLIADLSGLPALARILDELPEGADTTVIVEVADRVDLAYLPDRPDVATVVTVGTGNGHAPSRLPELARAHRHADGRGYCWFAGEAQATREVRKYLRNECGWVPDQYDIVGYWRFDSEAWDRKYEEVSAQVVAVYERALAEGKGEKIAAEEYDLALERIGL
jgi:NADPH-dependent ferric siderophore reductase